MSEKINRDLIHLQYEDLADFAIENPVGSIVFTQLETTFASEGSFTPFVVESYASEIVKSEARKGSHEVVCYARVRQVEFSRDRKNLGGDASSLIKIHDLISAKDFKQMTKRA